MLQFYYKFWVNNLFFTRKNKSEQKRSDKMDFIALLLVVIGALNWGSIGIFNFDIVGALFGGQSAIISRVIFTLVGLAGLWAITFFFRDNNKYVNGK